MMDLHSWMPARPECCDLVLMQIWQDRLIQDRKKNNILSNVYIPCEPVLITDTHRKHKSRNNVVICLIEHTRTQARTQARTLTSAHARVKWHHANVTSLHESGMWMRLYVCMWRSYAWKFITALPLCVKLLGTEYLARTSLACCELSLRGKTPSMEAHL